MKIKINSIFGKPLFEGDFSSVTQCVLAALLSKTDLRGADLGGADLMGANLKIEKLRVFTGLYKYQVLVVLAQDGTRYVRMGCLFKSLDEWDKIGIRNSNPSEFPDDKSEASEERVIAFEFAKAAALRLK